MHDYAHGRGKTRTIEDNSEAAEKLEMSLYLFVRHRRYG